MQAIDQKIILTIAEKAYEGKSFPDGTSVYDHCAELSNAFARLSCYELAGVALLHEVFNHSELTEMNLREMCLYQPVLDGIVALKKLDTENWFEYIERIKNDSACCHVKLFDIVQHGAMPQTDKEDYEYQFALMILCGWPVDNLKVDKFFDLIETPEDQRVRKLPKEQYLFTKEYWAKKRGEINAST